MIIHRYEPIQGRMASKSMPPVFKDPPLVSLPGVSSAGPATIEVPAGVAAKSFLISGASQYGKTNVMMTIMDQVLSGMGPDDVAYVLDSKLDFIHTFHRPGDPVLGFDIPGQPRYRQNFYQEVLADGPDLDQISSNCNQLSTRLYDKYQNTSQPFFHIAASRMFGSLLETGARIILKDPKRAAHYHNLSLRNYCRKASPAMLNRFINAADNSGELRSYVGDFSSNQSLGVLGEMNSCLSRYLEGPWGESGQFSIRQFIRDRGGKTLYVHYDLQNGDNLCELHGLAADLAFRELLSHPEKKPKGRAYFFFDELALLGAGAPEMLKTVVNYGISQGLGGVFVGIQSMAQLNDLYGQEGAQTLVAGFGNLISFHPNDAATRDLILDRAGTIETITTIPTSSGNHFHIDRTPVATPWELARLDVGEALVCLVNQPPFYFKFDKYHKKEEPL